MTLAEFTLNAGDDQTYYDISLVDGYNLPVAIVPQTASGPYFTGSKSNELSPSCMATAALLAPKDFNPYEQFPDFLGTYSSNPLPLETRLEDSTVAQWCPWNLQADRPSEPNGGVYQYPDGDIERAAFNPCFSSCSKWNKPEDCCTGQYDGPHSCSPSEYSKAAKMVCPDAYSYGMCSPYRVLRSQQVSHRLIFIAYDDQTSTFIVPAGSNFEIIFCPGGRSTDIYTKNDTRP